MRRRELMLLLAGAMTVARRLRAQQKVMPVVGFLSPFSAPSASDPFMAAFRQGLSDTGYVEGKNLAIEYRWAEMNYDRLPALAADLVARKVDLIVSIAAAPSLEAKNATSTIPIVFMGVSDPVAMGLVAGLARPGGNLTGFSNFGGDLMGKRLELLCELAPQARVIALLWSPKAPNVQHLIGAAQEAAGAKGVQLPTLKAATEGEIDAAFASLVELQAGALLVVPDAFFSSRRDQLVALASRHAVPALYWAQKFAAAGGLISYGISDIAVISQVGIYAGRILKGAKPADLPVQQPSKFELVINLKTAKALGLIIPQSILARADEVIE
jgi:putative ABC transport system substrate-binding protein